MKGIQVSLTVNKTTQQNTCPEGFSRQTYYLDDELIKKLNEYCFFSGYGKSDIVRRALREYFK